jgi:pyruvate kinase
MRRTKIVCTLGPSSHTIEAIERLAHAGANVFRLNFSHGDLEEHGHRIEQIRRIEEKSGKKYPIILDTKGPDIRTEDVEQKIEVKKGDTFTWTTASQNVYAKTGKNQVSHPGFVNDVEVGDIVVVDSGAFTMKVLEKTKTDVICHVNGDGIIGSRRHLNLPGKKISLPTITEKDWKDIEFGVKHNLDFCALSFSSSAADIYELRAYLDKKKSKMKIIPKIENVIAVQNLEEIIAAADGVMVARGDLGVEIPFENVPKVQHDCINLAAKHRKMTIVATEMLDSMIDTPMPTRAEVADVANAAFQRSDATMLSGETANGDFPQESVLAMSKILAESEKNMFELKSLRDLSVNTTQEAMSHMVAQMADDVLDIGGIIILTASGQTAISVAEFRPKAPIFAFTNHESTCRQLQLLWGTESHHISFSAKDPENSVQSALKKLRVEHPELLGKRFIVNSSVLVDGEFCLTAQIREL